MRFTAVTLLACALTGCQPTDEGVTTPPPDASGIWVVTGHHIPGIAAMSDSAALASYGLTIRLAEGTARSGTERCDLPRYHSRTASRDSLLTTDYHLGPGALPALDSLATLTIVDVSCDGEEWTAPGGTVILIDADHALTPWDAAFLELTRTHDLRAVGHDPEWRLEIVRGDSIRMQLDSGGTVVTTPDARETTIAGSDARIIRAITDAHNLGVMMEPGSCIHATRGDTLPLRVTVMLDTTHYVGCGGPGT